MFNMIKNIMKNLVSRPSTRLYPVSKREPFKDARGHISSIDIDKCIFCGICQRKCPSDAIEVDKERKSWEIDQYKCIICGVCNEVCPKKCIIMDANHKTSEYKKKKVTFNA